MQGFLEYGFGFLINFFIIAVIVRFIYYPKQRSKEYVFTFFAFNTIIFFVMNMMNDSEISLGTGFGLFAIFSILRYRTNTIPIREMTYLFIVTALPIINSVLLSTEGYSEFIVTNLAMIAVLFVLEREWGFEYEVRKVIQYERIELIHPDKGQELLADLERRTGLPIKRIEIGNFNFLRDSVRIKLYCDAEAMRNARIVYTADEDFLEIS